MIVAPTICERFDTTNTKFNCYLRIDYSNRELASMYGLETIKEVIPLAEYNQLKLEALLEGT